MAAVIIVAIGLLGSIFFASLVALIIICKHKHCGKMDFEEMAKQTSSKCRQDVELIGAWNGLEMYANYYPDEDEDPFIDSGWACDVDLIPYCVSLLKTCHHLTERLVAKTMEKSTYEMKSCEQMMEIIETARSISPRVDDVVKYMYPPLDSHQIESRSTALYMSVNHLVQITKTLCGNGESLAWAEQLLESMDQEIQAMRQIISNIAQLSSADSVSNTSISTRSSQSTEPMLEPKAELLA